MAERRHIRAHGFRAPRIDGATIREARKARGWSQAQLADVLDVTADTVGRWERDQLRPSRRAALALCYVLGIKPGKRTKTP